MNKSLICVGKILTAHGIKGAVKIHTFTQQPENIAAYGNLYDSKGNTYKIKVLSTNGVIIIAQIEGITSRSEAEILRNTELFIDKAALPKTKADEFYHVDLIGLKAKLPDNTLLGKVTNVYDYGAGGMIEITPFNSKNILTFPFTASVILEVNLEEDYLVVDASKYKID